MYTNVKEILQMKRQGIIKYWAIDSRSNSTIWPNVMMTCVTTDDKRYRIQAQYNPDTDQISEPLPSLVNWDNTYTIFNDSHTITKRIPSNYVDHEIDGQVDPTIFDPIFQSLTQFQYQKYRYELLNVPSLTGNLCALMREFDNDTNRLQVWITEEGWSVIYCTLDTFLIVGNCGGHPSVTIPAFSFGNSDGSTNDDDIDWPSITFDQIKDLVKTKTIECIWSQEH
jgi:hypothetical protein